MNKASGRTDPREDLISITVAARMLGVTPRMIQIMCRKGQLTPIYKENKGQKHFPIHEISALVELKKGMRSLDIVEIASTAQKAFILARANEQRLTELYRMLGLKRKTLEPDEEHVLSLYVQAQDRKERNTIPTLEELEEWACVFFSIDEEYLKLVEKHTASTEPWRAYFELASALSRSKPFDMANALQGLQAAFNYLEASRMHIRQVGYMYCREKYGVTSANKVFAHTNGIADRVLNIIQS